ncbi:LysR family transcriptional regulator [Comamonas sp. GB3 AK4-5]|uniref:LysR family transcriptional regulator n=1 Tax=Comamonas sp. GB3 AK4-5 TaxID=3231487 RepID=UPI00351E144B
MTFELQHLKAFHTIVATGSLGRAAIALHITQPALSRTIRKLEAAAGAALFERHSKGMQLTDIGRALLPHASLLLREAEHAQEEIRAHLGLARGVIRVGAIGSIACSVLPIAIAQTCHTWPQLQVQVLEGVWDKLACALTSHEIDLALGVALEDCDLIEAIPDCHWQDRSYIVAGSHHRLHHQPSLGLADTLEERWAMFPKGTGPFEQLKALFTRHGLPMPSAVVETRSVTMLKSLMGHSSFLGWMAGPMFSTESEAGLLAPLPLPDASDVRTLTAFRRRQGLLPAPASKFLEQLRKLTGPLSRPGSESGTAMETGLQP